MSEPNTPTLEEVAARLDHATADLGSLDSASRAVVDELLDAMGVLHKGALTTMVRRLRDDPRGRELLYELVDDPGVRMVLSVHGIIRTPPETDAQGSSAGHSGCGCGSGAGERAGSGGGCGSGAASAGERQGTFIPVSALSRSGGAASDRRR